MPLAADDYGLLPVADVAHAPLAAFQCGRAHLDEFLTNQAVDWHRKRIGLTTVVFHRDVAGVVAYFTLANDALPLMSSEQMELGLDVPLSAYPAVKLGRLAVASHLQGQGDRSGWARCRHLVAYTRSASFDLSAPAFVH
ncbi:hypothetical protein [Roseateles saccharophilus]|uniref:hypothetical protein n=1 Tax=Roseateles saccharophilus TaxID=304 RepID=UPI0010510AB0|nr:hypothetical protein [Roseateles saccharophilus]MDG0834310.1 hypothetical protein [Roseateles saccharophilus]